MRDVTPEATAAVCERILDGFGETIDEIWQAVPYCIDLLGGPYIDMVDSVCTAFRPKTARRR